MRWRQRKKKGREGGREGGRAYLDVAAMVTEEHSSSSRLQ